MPSGQPTPKKPNSVINLAILVVILVIVVSGAIYAITKNEPTLNTNTPVNTNTEANTNSTINTNTNLGVTSANVPFVDAVNGYQFQPPAGLYVTKYPETNNAVQFSRVQGSVLGSYSNTYLVIRIENAVPAQVDGVDIYLDSKPQSTKKVGGKDANVYTFPNGYEGTPAFVSVRVKNGNSYLRLDFWNVGELSDEIAEVLNSFTFTQ